MVIGGAVLVAERFRECGLLQELCASCHARGVIIFYAASIPFHGAQGVHRSVGVIALGVVSSAVTSKHFTTQPIRRRLVK